MQQGTNGARVQGPDVVLPGSEQLAPAFWALVTVLALVGLGVAWFLRRRRAARGAPARRPIGTAVLAVLTAVSVLLLVLTWPPAFTSPEFPALGPIVPDGSFFARPVDDLPPSSDSDRWISSFADEPLVGGFGGQPSGGVVFGIPFNPVDASTPRKEVDIRIRRDSSYRGPYPIADPAYIESMPTYGFDNHYVAIDEATRTVWELIGTTVWFGRWGADAGARWDLDELRFPESSTMASGLPLLPGVLTYDEVAAGEVRHVVHAGTPTTSRDAFVWPARSTDGRSDDENAPPMGSWLRLRRDADLSALGPQARVIAEGLQRYGMVLSDTSANLALRGTPDGRWDRADLRTLRSLTGADFEVVSTAGVIVDEDSMEARPPAR